MDMQRPQYENMKPHGVGIKSLREQRRGFSDFQRHMATLADNFDASLPYSMSKYEGRVLTTSEKQQWDTSWQRAPKTRMNDG